jgi:hypothetical protein
MNPQVFGKRFRIVIHFKYLQTNNLLVFVQTKMFNQGMKPVWRKGTSGKWERLAQEVVCSSGEGRIFQV